MTIVPSYGYDMELNNCSSRPCRMYAVKRKGVVMRAGKLKKLEKKAKKLGKKAGKATKKSDKVVKKADKAARKAEKARAKVSD